MSNCQVPMPVYERPEPLGELVDSLKRENDALKALVRDMYWFHATDWRYTPLMRRMFDDMRFEMSERMAALGIEVWE